MSRDMILRAATYNIRKSVGLDWRRDPERILAVLSELRADIVALQEADRRFGARISTLPPGALAEAGWRAAAFPRAAGGIGWRGNAVLLGPGARLLAARALPLPSLEPRGAVMAEIEVHGVTLRVAAMHLGLTGAQRMRQAAAILAEVEAGPRLPTILLGDMNEWQPSAGVHALFAERYRIAASGPSFHASQPVAALDRIVHSEDLTLRDCGVHHSALARRASDHLPVWAEFEPAAR